MAKLIENIDSLIELPYGCGEQNMINFVPNILVLEYFDHTGYGSADQRASALSNMQIGIYLDSQHSICGSKDVQCSSFIYKPTTYKM